ncbi:hypothetical protein ACFQ3K_09960 [Brucella gallinifaecis]|uniref:Uncharacterized protein n=1 Tax=Brucella gallinifaecis TaxID=215590 RepID=A0A502BRK5_9HYPH|nr:hypothetical protein [Brucella gallinifaecis]TPF76885.1 hypothetical protein FHY56_00485 [Brucella gallinifaecis]
MLIYINNEMENGIIAKIPLILDKDIKGFQGDAIDFEISSLKGQLTPADDTQTYKSLFQIQSGGIDLKNIYIAFSFNLAFTTPDGKKTSMTRSDPTYDWIITNGQYYCDAETSFGFTSGSRFTGNYSATITNPFIYIIKTSHLIDNKMSDPISIKAQFYPSSTYSVITPKDDIQIIISNRQNQLE